MSKDEAEELITKFLPLARTRAACAAKRYPGFDLEIESAAMEGLRHAVKVWNPALSSFRLMAAVAIYQKIAYTVAGLKRRGRLAMSAAYNQRPAHESDPLARIPARPVVDDDHEGVDLMLAAVEPVARSVVASHVLGGASLAAIAREIGASRAATGQALSRGLATLRGLPLARQLAGLE